MDDYYSIKKKTKSSLIIHIGLFVATFITCSIAGTQWANVDFTEVLNWHYGITYAVLILTFLSAHEFGHYFAAKYYGVDATLPYYIPFPIPIAINFGTLGAVIKTRSPIPNSKALFDIGAAGPIAGFIVSLIFLIYGFATLPPIDFLYSIHPEYITLYGGEIPNKSLFFGDTILFWLLAKLFANPNGFLPPMNEIYHYPFLNVGWFGLFVTTLNMLPIGQLDGGHITYAMFGRTKHAKIARICWGILIILGIFSLFGALYEALKVDNPNKLIIWFQELLLPILSFIDTKIPFIFKSWLGWLVWALVTKFFVKLDHPPVLQEGDIGVARKTIGWITIIILLLSFSYNGIYFIE